MNVVGVTGAQNRSDYGGEVAVFPRQSIVDPVAMVRKVRYEPIALRLRRFGNQFLERSCVVARLSGELTKEIRRIGRTGRSIERLPSVVGRLFDFVSQRAG